MTLPDTSTAAAAEGAADASGGTADVKQALDVLRGVLDRHNPTTRLFAAHRRDISTALDAAGITADTAVRSCIEETLTVAKAYEDDGMFAVMPNWDLLLSRVARLSHA